MRDFVRRLNRDRGITVILTTHAWTISRPCAPASFLSPTARSSARAPSTICAVSSSERRLIVDIEDDTASEVEDPKAEILSVDGHRVQLRFEPDRTPAAELIGRITSRWPVRNLFVENPPIEELVAALYREREG